jgi:nucleobase:cation symporter-1, NCS1 family
MTTVQGYGEKVAKVEPGGIEPVAAADKHGAPIQLFWTWTSPNLEFATIFVGVLAVSAFGLSFWQAAAAVAVGNMLGAISHGILSARGPVYGVPQMVLGRVPFGYRGNILPASLMSVMAGAGWFAVNSVSGAFALNSLTGWPLLLCLILIVAVQVLIAFFGHNLVQAFEAYVFPVLAVVFLVSAVVIFSKSSLGGGGSGGLGGFLLTAGAAFGYTAGWNPYAADYTRYLPADTNRRAVGWFAGSGLFLSTTVLMLVGAASMSIDGSGSSNPATAFTNHLPGWLGSLALLSIALGAVAANVLNVYSAALSFLTLGIRLPLAWRRAVVAVCFGTVGFVLAWIGLADAGHSYESFLLVIAYWVGPWLGVVLTDMHVRRGQKIDGALFNPRHANWSGGFAMLLGMIVSIGLFSNQSLYTGVVPKAAPWIGDITFLVGFAVAALCYRFYPRRPLR